MSLKVSSPRPKRVTWADLAKEELRRRREAEPRFRGEAAKIQDIRHSDEFLLSGPYETGKTFGALWLLDSLLREFPGSRAAIVRKVRAAMDGNVLETWRNVISIRRGVTPFGGEKPVWYDYEKGSRVYIGGLDNPGKTLSGERDFIYVNQAEELELEDWETLSSRATGRAAHAKDKDGVPIAILFGDCNPSHPQHWILSRSKDNLRLLPTIHRDNPTLYTDDGEITPRGKRTMKVLNALTGHQRDRCRDGKWVAAEGMIHKGWSIETHRIKRFPIPSDWRIIAGVDWGYTNPGCIGIWAISPDDVAYLIHEVYMTQQRMDWWCVKAVALNNLYHPDTWYCDPARPEFIEQFVDNKIPAVAADNAVLAGIDEINQRLIIDEDRNSRIYVFDDALEEVDPERVSPKQPCGFIEEVPGYVWKKIRGIQTEEPVKKNDHSMNMARYALYSIAPKGPQIKTSKIKSSQNSYERPVF